METIKTITFAILRISLSLGFLYLALTLGWKFLLGLMLGSTIIAACFVTKNAMLISLLRLFKGEWYLEEIEKAGKRKRRTENNK